MKNTHLPLLCCGLLLLTACGFRPIHASMGRDVSVIQKMSEIALSSIPDREGLQLRNHLIDRLYSKGKAAKTTMVLDVSLSSVERSLGLQKDATTLRQEISLSASYQLKNREGKELTNGSVRSVVGYNKLPAQYGTLVARQNAIDRASQEVGEQIVNRLSLYLAELPAAKTVESAQ